MSRMKNMLLPLILGGMMADGFGGGYKDTITPNEVSGTPPVAPLPKGVKEYWFNKNGGFSSDKMRKDEVVFKCNAINDKSAKKKYEKWLSKK